MADYWVSRDKYFCKYCKIYIADDKPSRIQHETGLRHKGNYERYIRDIYKRGARDAKDKTEEAKEIARIEAAAKAAMGIVDDHDGASSSSSKEVPVASTSKLAPPPPSAPKTSDPFANYTTAESLGYKDDAAEKEQEEKDLRHKEGTIGQWQKVAKKRPPPPPVVPTGGLSVPLEIKSEEGHRVKAEEGGGGGPEQHSVATKRNLVANQFEDDDDEPAARRKGYFTEKSYDLDDGSFDPTKIGGGGGGGGIKLKRKRLTLKEEQELERLQRERQERLVPIGGGGGTGNDSRGGWQEAEIKEEPLLEFEEQKPQLAEDPPQEEQEVKPSTTSTAKLEGSGGGTGFKKRKMHGAGTVRKK